MNNFKVGTHEPGQEVVEFDASDHIINIPNKGDPVKNLSGKYEWKESANDAKIKAKELALKEISKRY